METEVLEVDAGNHCPNQRHQHIVYQCIDNCGERTADNNTDCHIQYIAFGDKFLKFSKKSGNCV